MRRLRRAIVERFPRVRLELSEGLTETMCDRLLRAELDLGIVTMPQPNDHLDYETLVVEQVFLIGPPRDPAAAKRQADATRIQRAAGRGAAAQPQPVSAEVPSSLRVDGATPMKRIAASGLGYGLLPFSGIHQEVAAGTPIRGAGALAARRPRAGAAARPAREPRDARGGRSAEGHLPRHDPERDHPDRAGTAANR